MSETNPIEDLVQAAINQDFTAASDIFGDVMGEKMTDAIEQEKIAVASSIYNGEEIEIDDSEDDEDFDDGVEVDEEDLDFDEENDEVED